RFSSSAVLLVRPGPLALLFFFFTDTATTEIYTLSLHDALPICSTPSPPRVPTAAIPAPSPSPPRRPRRLRSSVAALPWPSGPRRSEEHTSELQSRENLVCRLLLEKKKNKKNKRTIRTVYGSQTP